MINITTKVSYPEKADQKAAYKLYLKNIKKQIKSIDEKGKNASVHFSSKDDILSVEFNGNKSLVTKIKKVIYGKGYKY